jgi:hypothetical protein
MTMKMSKIVPFLLTLIFPFAPEGDEDFVPEDDLPSDEDDDLPSDEDDDLPPDEDDEEANVPPPRQLSRAQQRIVDLSERAKLAEERERQARADLDAARRQPAQPATPNAEQQLWEQEEAILKDPAAEPWQRYSVQSARDARAARQEANMARRESADAADKAKYERFATTKPKLYAKYKDEVEKMLTEMRKNGNNAPRDELHALLVGRDMMNGKLKSTEAKREPKRGSTPGVRSDVRTGRGSLSDAEKRAKRLENVRI